jgi:hypothetical protein
MTPPLPYTGTTAPTQHQHVKANDAAWCRRDRRWREGVPSPNRCQAVGGARAANSARCGERKSNASGGSLGKRPEMCGSGKDGGSARTKALARWLRVQIEQRSSARWSRPPGSAGVICAILDASAAATVNFSADRPVRRSRCTCPQVRTSWSASANSARHEPHFDLDRSRLMAVACSGRMPGAIPDKPSSFVIL